MKIKKIINISILALTISSACFASDVQISGIAIKVTERSQEKTRFAVKADVTNNGDRDSVYARIQAVDVDGFKVDDVTLSGKIPQSGTRTLTENTFMKTSEFERIKKWEAKD